MDVVKLELLESIAKSLKNISISLRVIEERNRGNLETPEIEALKRLYEFGPDSKDSSNS
jgi:hypothetical protein